MIHPPICYRNLKHFSLTPVAHWLFQSNKYPRIWCKYWQTLCRRSRLWRLSRNGCQDSQGTPAVAGPGASPALGLCQGRVRAGKRQRQLRELPALSTEQEQKLKLYRAPRSPELKQHRDSCRALLRPKQQRSLCCWARLSTLTGAAAPAASAQLQEWFTSTRRQKHFSCAHPAAWLSSGLSLHFKLLRISALENQFYTIPLKPLLIIIRVTATHGCLVCLYRFFLTKRLIFN